MNHKTTRWGSLLAIVILTLAFSFTARIPSAHAATKCGEGAAPDYGFSYSQQQPHWTVGWQGYASTQAVEDVDVILDQLNAESIAQTMILIEPQEQVGNRVNCAVHFLRYMKLGLPTGERKDNGFVFLIVIEPDRVDVHYGVGLGLPALTASELTTLNRAAEDTYQSTRSIDQVLITLAQEFATVARNKYPPLPTANESETESPPGPMDIFILCGILCLGFFIMAALIILAPTLNKLGFGGGRSSGGWRGGGGFGGGFGGGRSSGGGGGISRGGSGSGRSGRGN